jgi:hypothetical protein
MNAHIWRINGFTMEYLANDIVNLSLDAPVQPAWSEDARDAFLYFNPDAHKAADLLRASHGITRPHVETLLDPPERPVEHPITPLIQRPLRSRHKPKPKPKPCTPKHIPVRIGRLFGYDPFD